MTQQQYCWHRFDADAMAGIIADNFYTNEVDHWLDVLAAQSMRDVAEMARRHKSKDGANLDAYKRTIHGIGLVDTS